MADTTKNKSTTAKPRKRILTPGKEQSAAAPKPAPAPLKAVPSTATPAISVKIANPVLRKAEVVERVVKASGVKKKYVKPAVEAALEVLGKAMEDGEELNLHPFGRIVVKRQKDFENARVFTCKVRRRLD